MNVREMMSVHPRCVSRRTKIVDAARLMAEAGVGALPVYDEKRVVGIVTDRDIVLRSVAEHPASPLVESVMTLSPYTINVHAPLERAEARQLEPAGRRAAGAAEPRRGCPLSVIAHERGRIRALTDEFDQVCAIAGGLGLRRFDARNLAEGRTLAWRAESA